VETRRQIKNQEGQASQPRRASTRNKMDKQIKQEGGAGLPSKKEKGCQEGGAQAERRRAPDPKI
jgi:hypothetical protein